MSGTALPVEVAEQIIDYLSKDRNTLLTCSKVARGWRPRALSYLFHSIQIRDESYTIFSLGNVLVIGLFYFAGFQRTMPHLLLYLRHLTFSASNGDFAMSSFARQLTLPPHCALDTLEFAGDENWPVVLEDLSARIPSFRQLRLQLVRSPDFVSFPELGASHLDIGLSVSPHRAPREPPGRRPPPTIIHTALRQFTARISGEFTFGDMGLWLSSVSQRAPNIQSVAIVQKAGGPRQTDVTERAISEFIASTRPTARLIHTLQIAGDVWKDIGAVQYNALLTHLKRLRILKIVISLRNSAREAALTLLEPLKSLEHMQIVTTGAHQDMDLGAICDWASLEDILVSHSPRFRRLTVTVVPARPSGITPAASVALRSFLAGLLPRLHQDGQLYVVVFAVPG